MTLFIKPRDGLNLQSFGVKNGRAKTAHLPVDLVGGINNRQIIGRRKILVYNDLHLRTTFATCGTSVSERPLIPSILLAIVMATPLISRSYSQRLPRSLPWSRPALPFENKQKPGAVFLFPVATLRSLHRWIFSGRCLVQSHVNFGGPRFDTRGNGLYFFVFFSDRFDFLTTLSDASRRAPVGSSTKIVNLFCSVLPRYSRPKRA